jgi:hypothetical protein
VVHLNPDQQIAAKDEEIEGELELKKAA